ncbi:MAG: hypothetical protein NNA21_11985 [Nitrospira sp.]|nr:hypothetical protein [Nitrospira sp.]MCP9475463.1 hypothetical protein [Nitrospira sp.]
MKIASVVGVLALILAILVQEALAQDYERSGGQRNLAAEIESLKQRITEAGASKEIKELRNAYLDLFAQYASTIIEFISKREYEKAKSVLKEWEEALEKAMPALDEKQRFYSHSRHQMSSGYLWESMGLAAYFLDGDYVNAPRLLEKAEVHHERAAELASHVQFAEDAPVQAREIQKSIVAMQQAEAKRVKGMRLLAQGGYESEAGNLDRAIQMLEESVETLKVAEEMSPAEIHGSDPIASITEKWQRPPSFIDFARALLYRTLSDRALVGGDFLTAAVEQQNRAEALKRAQSMHLRIAQPLHESFARMLARDIHIAYQRHDNLMAEAQSRARLEWLWALAFFAMAIGSVALFIWLSARFEIVRNKVVFTLLLLFVMAVAGIGAQQVKWKDAANWLKGSFVGSLSKDKS